MTYNMHTMIAEECRTSPSEQAYRTWLNTAGKILGRYVVEGTQDEDDLYDLYADGCTPAEAVTEIVASRAPVFLGHDANGLATYKLPFEL